MKRIMSCIVTAMVAVAFAGLVSAADQPSGTSTGTTTDSATGSMTGDTDTAGKPMKKAKKKKAKKAKKTRVKAPTESGDMQNVAPSGAPPAK